MKKPGLTFMTLSQARQRHCLYNLRFFKPFSGNRKINELTSNGLHELRVDLTDFDGNSGYAKYSRFSVGDASTQYRLEVGGYSGNIGE